MMVHSTRSLVQGSRSRLNALLRAVRGDPGNLRWISYWLRHRHQSPVQLRLPWITFLAMEWLATRIQPGFSVLEYGSGGSTLFFASHCRQVLTVEHDSSWAAALRPALESFGQRVEVRVVPPRPGVSSPVVPSRRYPDAHADFHDYVAVSHQFPDHSFDVISIDGRARCACVAACRSKLKPGGLLILDNSERSDYGPAFELLADWERWDFFGLGLQCVEPWRTTVWRSSHREGYSIG